MTSTGMHGMVAFFMPSQFKIFEEINFDVIIDLIFTNEELKSNVD